MRQAVVWTQRRTRRSKARNSVLGYVGARLNVNGPAGLISAGREGPPKASRDRESLPQPTNRK